jgi:hypothetical protein
MLLLFVEGIQRRTLGRKVLICNKAEGRVNVKQFRGDGEKEGGESIIMYINLKCA